MYIEQNTEFELFFLRIKKLIYVIFKPKSWIGLPLLVIPGFEHSKILKLLKKQKLDLIIDIGSNKGQFTFVSKLFFPEVNVLSFEALNSQFKKYQRLAAFFKNIKAYNYALGSYQHKTRMNVASSPDSSSILPIKELQKRYFGIHETNMFEDIEIKILDEWIEEISKYSSILLKIDVQGYELEVLKGSKEVLKKINYLYIEASSVELYENQPLLKNIEDFLNSEGFILKDSFNKIYDKKRNLIQGDYFFKKTPINIKL